MKRMLIGGVMMIIAVQAWGFAGGNGSESDPFQITTPAELDAVRTGVDKHYILMNDIDLNDVEWTPIGDEATPFTGTFDGNGKMISGLWIAQSDKPNVGMFGYVEGNYYIQSIRNLTLQLSDKGVTGFSDVGGMIGTLEGGTVYGCKVQGHVAGRNSVGLLAGSCITGRTVAYYSIVNGCSASGMVIGEREIGGLVGYNEGDMNEGCHTDVEVEAYTNAGGLVGYNYGRIFHSYAIGSVLVEQKGYDYTGSGKYAGGLVGVNNGTIYLCYSTAEVSGLDILGGLVGDNAAYVGDVGGLIDQCYAAGRVDDTPNTGGLVGWNHGKMVNCVYDSQTTGQSKGIGRVESGSDGRWQSLTTSEMYDLSNYWDWLMTGANSEWLILDGCSYPYLRYYSPVPRCADPVIQITAQPTDLTLNYGGSGELSVVAALPIPAALPFPDDLSYQWYRSSAATSDGDAIPNANSPTYSISGLSAGDYYYYCVISAPTVIEVKDVRSDISRVSVARMPLHISVADTFRTYGTDNPTFRLIYSGFIDGEDTTFLTSLPEASCSADRLSSAGTYTITVSGGSSNNYTFTYESGDLRVLPASPESLGIYADTSIFPVRVVIPSGVVGIGYVSHTYYNGVESFPDTAGVYVITIDLTSGMNYSSILGLVIGTYIKLPAVVVPPPVAPVDTVKPTPEPVKPKPDPDPVKPKPVEPVPVDPSDPVPSDPVPVEPDPDVISVWIPSISGISTLPSPGRYPVTPGTTFTLTVQTTTPLPVIVSTSRSDTSLLHIVPTTPTSLTVHILDVRESLTVSFRLDPPSSTFPSPSPRVWTTPGYLHTESLTPQLVKIYNTSGQLLHMFPLLGTINTALPKGFYIVSTGKQQHKVLVR
jgi:hypothetical protein